MICAYDRKIYDISGVCRRRNINGTGIQRMEEKLPVNGAADEMARIYRMYFTDVYKFVYRKIPNKQIAEDIAQDTFLLAVKKREEILKHPNPRAWLLRTARYKMMELNRKMNRWDMEYLEECPELEAPEHHYERIELELTALATVNEKEWDMIKQYYLCGTTITEMAEAEGITENYLRVRLSRLRKKLRDSME